MAAVGKIYLSIPVLVEGRYDKIRLSNVIDANIITTDGFGIFSRKEKLRLIVRLSQNGLVVLTDSDGAGKVIRGHIASAVPRDKLYNLYIPQISGKEARKSTPSKEGTLGVEGMDDELLRRLFESLCREHPEVCGGERSGREPITKADFLAVGLTGEGSKEARDSFAQALGLMRGMTPNALLCAVEMLMTRAEFFDYFKDKNNEFAD